MIPRIINQPWVGPLPAPDKLMATWRDMNPTWSYVTWRDHKKMIGLGRRPDGTTYTIGTGGPWTNQAAIDAIIATGQWGGATDLMRYEILERFGGVYIDSDSECVRPLDDHFLDHEVWASWENEGCRPGVITGAFLGSVPGSALMKLLVENVAHRDMKQIAWRSVGPTFLTEVAANHPELFVYPSKTFIPEHYDGTAGQGDGHTYGRHAWGNTANVSAQVGAKIGRVYEIPKGTAAIIPCKGDEYASFLAQAVASVRAQTVEVDEIVVVCGDDASAREAKRLGVQVVREDWTNVGRARNVGARESKSFSMLFLDADDTLNPIWVERTRDSASGTRYVVGTSMRFFGERGGVFHHPPLDKLAQGNALGNCCLISRELFDAAGGYDETLDAHEDWDLWLRCAKHNPQAVMLREPLLNYRRHAGQMLAEIRRNGTHGKLLAELHKRHPDIYRTLRPEELAAAWHPEILGLDSGGILMWHQEVARKLPQGAKVVILGVFHGRDMLHLAQLLFELGNLTAEIHGVDPFEYYAQSGEITKANAARVLTWGKDGPQVFLHPTTATNAASNFADGSLSLVFEDAVHTEEAVAANIATWLPKLRHSDAELGEGGFFAGHDYTDDTPGVKRAVDAAFGVRVKVAHGGVWWIRV